MSTLLDKYSEKLKKDKVTKLSLVDRVAAKNQLKDKLIAEIQGLRTRETSYTELTKVNKRVIENIVKDVRKQLHLD